MGSCGGIVPISRHLISSLYLMIVVIIACNGSAFDLLMHRNIQIASLVPIVPSLSSTDPQILSRVEIDGTPLALFPLLLLLMPLNLRIGTYAQHLRRQAHDVRLFLQDESLTLDASLDYASVEGLSSEVRERLERARPASIVRPLLCPIHARTDGWWRRARRSAWRA